MFIISSTIFHSGMSGFMDEYVKKLRLLLKFAMRVQVIFCQTVVATHMVHCRSNTVVFTRLLTRVMGQNNC